MDSNEYYNRDFSRELKIALALGCFAAGGILTIGSCAKNSSRLQEKPRAPVSALVNLAEQAEEITPALIVDEDGDSRADYIVRYLPGGLSQDILYIKEGYTPTHNLPYKITPNTRVMSPTMVIAANSNILNQAALKMAIRDSEKPRWRKGRTKN